MTSEVNTVPPPARLFVLALQHVLVMYAGAVAVPLILGGALKLPREQIAFLINADLFACGIASFIQSFGAGPFGVRLPVMMGVTFASLSPMLAMANNPDLGLAGIYGSVIAAGIFGILAAPLISRLLPFFPSVVTGSIITVIGITLMRIGLNWAGGAPAPAAPNYGAPEFLLMAALVLGIILLLLRFGATFLQNIAVLIGIVTGYLLAVALGGLAIFPRLMPNFSGLDAQPWVALVYPLQFGLPKFDLVACVSMCLVMVVVMIESTGMFLALGEMTGEEITPRRLTAGLRADGLGTIIGGLFNTFPYTSFSQNVGLVGVTGVRSRFVCVAGGGIMLVLGLLPKLAFLVASVPLCVLGGAGVVMFGMVAATGIKILAGVDYQAQRQNLFIVAIAIGFGMIPLVTPALFKSAPDFLKTILDSGILLATVAAVLLNAYFNKRPAGADAVAQAKFAASAAEHM